MSRAGDPPVLLVRWCDLTKWLLEQVERSPKSQRFVAIDIIKCIDLIARGERRGGCQRWYLDANAEALSWPWSMQGFRQALRQPVLSEDEISSCATPTR